MNITKRCPCCGQSNTVIVEESDYKRWKEGALIQSAFPYLTADEREILLSGICNTCWEKLNE